MAFDLVPFSSMEWQPGGHPLEQKKVPARGPGRDRMLTLLRFDVGFEDPAWCENGHHLYVVSGAFELELDDGPRRLAAGDACVLDPGTRHKARNPGGEPVVLFVLSELAE